MADTLAQYDNVIERCKALFLKKVIDYGTSWRVLRPIAIVDQIYIKAWRIRQVQELGTQKIADSIEAEFIGIINYAIIALIQGAMAPGSTTELMPEEAARLYDEKAGEGRSLMILKNHDYGEAWRNMSQASFVDLILVKLLRAKQIIANDGITIASEGIEANFADILNYAVFALMQGAEAR